MSERCEHGVYSSTDYPTHFGLPAFAKGSFFQKGKHPGHATKNQSELALKTSSALLLPLCLLLTACGPASDKRVSELEAELRLAKADRKHFRSENEELNRTCENLENQSPGAWIKLA